MADRIIFVCIVVLAVVYFCATKKIPAPDFSDPMGPMAFPYLLGIGLLITAGLLLKEIFQAKKSQEVIETVATKKQDLWHLLVIGAVVVWTGLYFVVFEVLGYLIATAIYLFVLMAFFNRGQWVTNGLTSVLFCIGSYLLFHVALGVFLPKGLLNF